MIKAYKLVNGFNGHSHIIIGHIAENLIGKATSIHFRETPAGTYFGWHTAPDTQFVLTLTGTLEFTVFSGEKFTLNAGEVLIAMDTAGSGHTWQMLGDEPWKRAYVVFDNLHEPVFVEDEQN